MFLQSYCNSDLEQLTDKARTLWEYDFDSTPKRIKRRTNVIKETIPLQAIYRMVKEDWLNTDFSRYNFPFQSSNFSSVLGLSNDWHISVNDRKFIEKDMILFASNGREILILPEKKLRWWETTWFNITSWTFGALGLILTILQLRS